MRIIFSAIDSPISLISFFIIDWGYITRNECGLGRFLGRKALVGITEDREPRGRHSAFLYSISGQPQTKDSAYDCHRPAEPIFWFEGLYSGRF
jgi:hypothetical protein